MEIIVVKERSMAEIGETAKETSEAIQKFNKWVESSNKGGTVSEEEADLSTKSDSPFDGEEEDIDFSE
jgi:hypothetical protein